MYSQFEELVGEEEGCDGHVRLYKLVIFSILWCELPSFEIIKNIFKVHTFENLKYSGMNCPHCSGNCPHLRYELPSLHFKLTLA